MAVEGGLAEETFQSFFFALTPGICSLNLLGETERIWNWKHDASFLHCHVTDSIFGNLE